jgi:hypothetical protein
LQSMNIKKIKVPFYHIHNEIAILMLLISLFTKGYCQCGENTLFYFGSEEEKYIYPQIDSINAYPFD